MSKTVQSTPPGVRPAVVVAILGVSLLLILLIFWMRPVLAPESSAAAPEPSATIDGAPAHPEMTTAAAKAKADETARDQLEEKWGIRVVGLYLSLRGNMLDLRYRLIDPGKAGKLVEVPKTCYLLDPVRGDRLSLQISPNAGPQHNPSQEAPPGYNFFTLIPNPEARYKAGDRLTLMMGGGPGIQVVVQ